jgi:hypothetical protein
MFDCLASGQSGTRHKKNADGAGNSLGPGQGKKSSTRMLRYLTEIFDAGMPMPPASTAMQCPETFCINQRKFTCEDTRFFNVVQYVLFSYGQ